jgi:hypothetical protein
MAINTLALNQLLSKNIPLHAIVAHEVNQTPYGTITFNVVLQSGVARLETLNIVKNKRKRYNSNSKV